ncbi:MAG: hypothetical protein ACLS4Z_04060 [Christensenellaceae bacterium]
MIGSTGSIGRQVCSVVRRHKDKFKIESLVANSSAEAFLKQAEEFRPSYAVLADERAAAEIKDKIPEGVRFAWGRARRRKRFRTAIRPLSRRRALRD